MATKVVNKHTVTVKWRKGRGGKYEVETFDTELAADQFKLLVEAAGNDWPVNADGVRWIKGQGFVTEDEIEPTGTDLMRYAIKQFDIRLGAESINIRTHGKYRGYVRTFIETRQAATELASMMEEDDDLRLQILTDPTSAYELAASIECPEDPTMLVETVDKDAVQEFVTYMRVLGRKRKTIRNYVACFHTVFDEAVDDGLLIRNPAARVKIGKTDDKRPKVMLTTDEFHLIWLCMDHRYRDFIAATVGTGLRFGEVTALTKNDWDHERRILTVNKAWKRGLKGHVVGTTKTSAGVREVPVNDTVAEILDRRCANRFGNDLIFTAPRGGRIRQNVFGYYWQVAVAMARQEHGLTKEPRFHDLRHTFITWLRDAGLPDVAIKDIVGHTDEQMTGKYGGVGMERVFAATDTVGANLKVVA